MPAQKPPGLRSFSPAGHLPEFRADPLRFLTNLHARFGDVAAFRLAHLRAYLISDPELVKEILVTRSGEFIKSPALRRAKVLLGEGLLTSEAPVHLRQRRLSQPAFHRDRLQGYGQTMVEHTVRKLSEWETRSLNGQTANIHAEMTQLTLGIVAKTLYDADLQTEAISIAELSSAMVRMFQVMTIPFAEKLVNLPLPVGIRFRKARARLDSLMYGMIAERRASGGDKGDLLSMLLMAQDNEDGNARMTDVQLRDEILTLFLAGHETTANALTWTWYLLSQHPEAERRFHEEIDTVLDRRLPGVPDVETLRYTYAVLAESIRLYPPAWSLARTAKHRFELGGFKLPAGALCMMSTYVMHRDARFWPEPDSFRPERWLTPDEHRPKFAYFPFGAGPRVCIGERFAWMEGVLLLATIGQKWRFKLAPEARVEALPLITLRPRHGMPVIMERR